MVCLYYGQTVTSATTKILFEIIKQCCNDVWHSTISHLACVGREMKAGRGWVAGELRSDSSTQLSPASGLEAWICSTTSFSEMFSVVFIQWGTWCSSLETYHNYLSHPGLILYFVKLWIESQFEPSLSEPGFTLILARVTSILHLNPTMGPSEWLTLQFLCVRTNIHCSFNACKTFGLHYFQLQPRPRFETCWPLRMLILHYLWKKTTLDNAPLTL